MKNNWIGIGIAGMSLATAWAIRGQFGHEQGAALAGAIGALAIILIANRLDWYKKALPVVLASAVGWGATGMISYGQVVGYGRSVNFPNALYGLLMLFVIGALFGLLGGGLTALTLEDTLEKKVKWGNLLAEMCAGGLVFYYFIVEQLGVLMTPPRSEAWAVCLGAGIAMIWYMARNNFNTSIRVAVITSMGAGFGFAFGNFLQITGNIMQVDFNMWNVMEYSIGFFGGTAMAWSIFTSVWPETDNQPKHWENKSSFLLVFALIPAIVYRESLEYNVIMKRLGEIPNPELTAGLSTLIALFLMCGLLVLGWILLKRNGFETNRKLIFYLFAGFLILYISISYLVSGLLAGITHLNHHLYVLNVIVVFFLVQKIKSPFFENLRDSISGRSFLLTISGIILIILLLTLILINIHGDLGGSKDRFNFG